MTLSQTVLYDYFLKCWSRFPFCILLLFFIYYSFMYLNAFYNVITFHDSIEFAITLD